ncbi:FAD-dependent oxidoreductase [Paenibacillus hodogayensis]|uniref:FAD-dependent oxidoreductase n=1 Tax=Paenibacillus hodogayensis TaxID=279208 RepID=A0ABV5VUI0_9BACL
MGSELRADLVIIGGGTGGCAAALAACRTGKTVVMTEETEWIGGQLTSQAVPPDEHRWIEARGCTRSYRAFREGVRSYYRTRFPLTADARLNPLLNPGSAIVSPISHEPRAALAVLLEMLAPYIHSGRLIILYHTRIESAETDGDAVRAVAVVDTGSGERTVLTAPYMLDATDCGDVLPLAGIEYVTGAESKRDTGEAHAVDGPARPMDMQAFTYCYVLDYWNGEDHTIDKPKDYAFWRSYKADFWPNELLNWTGVRPDTLEPRQYALFRGQGLFPLWEYRRIVDARLFEPGTFGSDMTVVNWPQNDYWLGSVIDVPEKERQRHLEGAKQLSLSLLYWMQTEAPRPDGGIGYPGLRHRRDAVGTKDGLAMSPYIRESRRIRAAFTVLEQHVSAAEHPDGRAELFRDAVGIGSYPIDLHPSSGNRPYIDVPSLPFQIPLGSLIPIRMQNVIPACKNIGTTHITNGCYRLHPVEWNIGESAGLLVSYCLDQGCKPRDVYEQAEMLEDFQSRLVAQGIELAWPE